MATVVQVGIVDELPTRLRLQSVRNGDRNRNNRWTMRQNLQTDDGVRVARQANRCANQFAPVITGESLSGNCDKKHQQQQQQQSLPIRTYSLQHWMLTQRYENTGSIGFASQHLPRRCSRNGMSRAATSKTSGSSTLARSQTLAALPTSTTRSLPRQQKHQQQQRQQLPRAKTEHQLPCLELFIARSLTQVMENRPASGWSAERHASAIEKVSGWLPEVSEARCLDDLLASQRLASEA